jgi:hypothetical protein
VRTMKDGHLPAREGCPDKTRRCERCKSYAKPATEKRGGTQGGCAGYISGVIVLAPCDQTVTAICFHPLRLPVKEGPQGSDEPGAECHPHTFQRRHSHAHPRASVGRYRLAGLVRTSPRRLQRQPLPRASDPGNPEQGQPFRSRLPLLFLRGSGGPLVQAAPNNVLHHRFPTCANFHLVSFHLSHPRQLIRCCLNQPFPLSDPHRSSLKGKLREGDSLPSLATLPHLQPPA